MGMPQDRPGEMCMKQGPYVSPFGLPSPPPTPHPDLVVNVTQHSLLVIHSLTSHLITQLSQFD